MIKIGIYPGTFDPITNGHIDVVKRSLKIVDKLFIAVSNDYSKDYLFSAEVQALTNLHHPRQEKSDSLQQDAQCR